MQKHALSFLSHGQGHAFLSSLMQWGPASAIHTISFCPSQPPASMFHFSKPRPRSMPTTKALLVNPAHSLASGSIWLCFCVLACSGTCTHMCVIFPNPTWLPAT